MNTSNEELKPTENTSTEDAAVAPAASQQEENDDEKEKTTTPTQQQMKENKKEQEEDPDCTSERAEDVKVLDDTKTTTASTIVCSFCDLPETLTRNFDKLKCPCKSTQYCNTTCQRNHWLEHKKNCQHLIAGQKRKKQLAKEQREREANASGVDGESMNLKMVKGQPHDPMLKKEEVNDIVLIKKRGWQKHN